MPAREVFSSVWFLSSYSGVSLAWCLAWLVVFSCCIFGRMLACFSLMPGLPWRPLPTTRHRPRPNLRGTEGVALLSR